MADTTTELEVLDEIVDVLGGQSGQYETVVPTLQQIRDLLGGGGGGGGYNPALSVGRADALTGADETAQWAQRVSTGNGAATVRSVQGAAVVWNQLAPALTSSNYTAYQFTDASFSDGIFTGMIGGTVSTLFRNVTYTANHRYMLMADVKAPAGVTVALVFTYAGSSMSSKNIVGTGAFVRDALWYTATGGPSGGNDRIALRNFASESIGSEISAKNIQLFDLTAMFGAGNEPATVAEFEAMYPEAYYPYSAPTLKPVQIAGIRSTTAQGGELDSVEWEAQTLRAAGSVADELTAGELVTRVGVVQVTGGASSTIAQSTDGTCINALVLIPNYDSTAGGGISSDQFTETSAGWRMVGLYEVRNAGASGGVFIGLPLDVSTQAQVNAWLAEHKPTFWYELANPTTTPISPALPMTYRVQQGGTESIIVPDGEVSAAPMLTIADGESAASLVMDALACIATPDGPTATANHAINTYLTMQGKLYKVTSAIAVGESITPNTNVTETTVMAELVARTA